MDAAKCERLKSELSGQAIPVVAIERYFDRAFGRLPTRL
jgi:hypothetical protein